jgi:hypothetical protein
MPDSIITVWSQKWDTRASTEKEDMARSNNATRLTSYEQRYRDLAAQLADIGLISSGSVTRRYTHCTSSGCKCNGDPPQPHGPYYQWTAKVDGKTVTRRLSSDEAKLYKEWITNDRRMRRVIEQMRQVAAKAGELKMKEVAGS